jgi:2-desacetyl-2-hydroxyethyl bacteriochlorophyllide A dehydrogenase
MLAATYTGDGQFAVGECAPVPPGRGQVRLDVAYVGICGTDLHIKHGAMDHRVGPPAVIGHEMSGRVAELGHGVDGWRAGQPVTVMPLRWCGACAACRGGHQHVCERLVFVGIDAPGAMQQSWTVDADLLVALPEDLPLQLAALTEPLAVAVHDVRRSGLTAGQQVLVVGGGPIGVLVAAVARAAGADVVVSELSPARRATAQALGLATVDPGAADLAAFVADWTGGAGVPVAFEVSGSAQGLADAVAAAAVRGRVVVVAIHPQPTPVDLHRMFWRELTLIGARVYERADYERAVDLLARGAIDVAPLVTSVQPLGHTQEAFAILEQGDAAKVLIDCGRPA